MSNSVFVVVINERHSDTDVELFVSAQAAVIYARKLVREYAHPDYPGDVDETLSESMRKSDWLYYGKWSGEGEHIFVVEREIK